MYQVLPFRSTPTWVRRYVRPRGRQAQSPTIPISWQTDRQTGRPTNRRTCRAQSEATFHSMPVRRPPHRVTTIAIATNNAESRATTDGSRAHHGAAAERERAAGRGPGRRQPQVHALHGGNGPHRQGAQDGAQVQGGHRQVCVHCLLCASCVSAGWVGGESLKGGRVGGLVGAHVYASHAVWARPQDVV